MVQEPTRQVSTTAEGWRPGQDEQHHQQQQQQQRQHKQQQRQRHAEPTAQVWVDDDADGGEEGEDTAAGARERLVLTPVLSRVQVAPVSGGDDHVQQRPHLEPGVDRTAPYGRSHEQQRRKLHAAIGVRRPPGGVRGAADAGVRAGGLLWQHDDGLSLAGAVCAGDDEQSDGADNADELTQQHQHGGYVEPREQPDGGSVVDAIVRVSVGAAGTDAPPEQRRPDGLSRVQGQLRLAQVRSVVIRSGRT